MRKHYSAFLLILFIALITIVPISAQALRYNVQSGDSIWKISQRFGVPMEEIIDLNNIENSNDLFVGQELIIKENNENQTTYTVKQGDSLWKISQELGVTIQEIIDVNDNIDSNYNIYIGQTINIPGSDDNDSTTDESYAYYRVQRGDILWNIAQKYGVTVRELAELNNIQDGYDIYPGRTLLIPVYEDDTEETDEEEVTEKPEESPESYIPYYFYYVQEDDQIWTIANKFGLRVSELVTFNNISDINDIEEDTLLVVPLNKSSNFNYIRNNNQKLNNHYRVRSQETLTEIAEYFETPEEGLRAINNLTQNEEVYTGQQLLMPVSSAFFTDHKIYQVKSDGEYLFDIAYNKGVSIRSILKANYFRNPNIKFDEGNTIIVPVDEDSQTTWIDFKDGKPQNSIFFN